MRMGSTSLLKVRIALVYPIVTISYYIILPILKSEGSISSNTTLESSNHKDTALPRRSWLVAVNILKIQRPVSGFCHWIEVYIPLGMMRG